jgi:hypothetical protein
MLRRNGGPEPGGAFANKIDCRLRGQMLEYNTQARMALE